MEGQVIDMEQEVIITNNNLLLHFSGHNNDLLVVKQWKGALNRIMPELRGLLRARSLFLRRPRSSGIILYVNHKARKRKSPRKALVNENDYWLNTF